MKNNWKKVKFNEIVLFARTGLNPRKNFVLGVGTNKYVTIKNIFNNTIDFDKSDLIDDKAINLIHKRSKIKKGDILFASIGRIGDMYIIENEPKNWDINESVFAFTLDTNIIHRKYFYYLFKSSTIQEYIRKNSSGSTFKSIKMNQLNKMQFNLPPMEEQKKIVDVLDKLNNIIEKRKKQLEKLDELIKSKFIEMFGDPVTNPKKWIVDNLIKVAPIEHFKIKNKIDKIWLLNLDAIESNTGRIVYKEYISFDDISSSTCFFNNEVVLYSKLRPYLNKVVIPNELGVATSELLPLKPNISKLNKIFFAYLLRTDNFVSFISNKVAGAKMPRVSMKDFYSFEVILPPLNLQNKFAEFVKTVEKQKNLINKSLEKLEITLKSLIQEYFE